MFPALCLSPSYEPTGVLSWERALTLVVVGDARCEAVYEGHPVVTAGGRSFPRPAVIVLNHSVTRRKRRTVTFSRRALWERDNGQCQYCHTSLSLKDMTIDHVDPRAQGGVTHWENVVAACFPCNSRKADRTPAQAGMRLDRAPRAPRRNDLLRKNGPELWAPYLETQ